MDKKGSFKKIADNKGFYAAILLCVIGVVVASFATIKNVVDENIAQDNIKQQQEEQAWGLEDFVNDPVEKKEENLPITDSSTSSSTSESGSSSATSDTSSSKTAPESTTSQEAQASQYVRPVEGSIIGAFSGEELVFNETMGDWRTHNGVDYKTEIGTKVSSIMAGTVKDVREDATWGHVVEVTSGDYTIRYMGLDNKVKVKIGDEIAQGADLGKTGEILAEVTTEPHLHLEVVMAGEQVDPERLFTK